MTDPAQAQQPHRIADSWIADSWRDCVVQCSCGWQGAERTMGKAKEAWLEHVAETTHD